MSLSGHVLPRFTGEPVSSGQLSASQPRFPGFELASVRAAVWSALLSLHGRGRRLLRGAGFSVAPFAGASGDPTPLAPRGTCPQGQAGLGVCPSNASTPGSLVTLRCLHLST